METKIAIIIHQQTEESGHPLQKSLSNLLVPVNVHVDIVSIIGGKSRAAAYNAAMQQSNAKYKIYVDEHARILKKDFLAQLLRIFALDEKIGMIGLAGTKVMPANGFYQKAKQRTGRIVFGKEAQEIIWKDFVAKYDEVVSVDGYILATSQDIPWREDLFGGSSFFDTAQCIEFHRLGYKVVVPRQMRAWGQFLKDSFNTDEESRNAFLDEYSKDIYPLVTVMIPTYNRPQYFKEALESVIHQTYRNLDIVITDNSHNDLTEQLMQEYLARDKRITYEHHPDFDAAGNWGRAREYNNPDAEYINWLMDDDIFMPDKIEKMIQYYFDEPGLTLVTSYRQLIDSAGKVLPDEEWSKPIVQNTSRFDGQSIGKGILMAMNNFVGEPTTALICKKYLRNNDLGWSGREGKYLISDFTTWLHLMTQGDMLYIVEPLSCFRQHANQDQNSIPTRVNGFICWAMEMQYAWEQHMFFCCLKEYKTAILHWLLLVTGFLIDLVEQNEQSEDILVMQQHMAKFTSFLSNNSQIEKKGR